MTTAQVTLRVPATSANLGPGFDCMGVAVGLYSTVAAQRTKGPPRVQIVGVGAGILSNQPDNLVYRAAMACYEVLGRERPNLALSCNNKIPLNRGLGSSSAAIVGGVAAAAALEGVALTDARLLKLAAEMEGHPDNVTPALLGGFQVVVETANGLAVSSPRIKRGLKAIAFIPEQELATKTARGVLPDALSRADVVFQASRTALLVAALTRGEWELLEPATADRLHQPARMKLMPFMPAVFAAARAAGAKAVFLSGAGPTVLALATDKFESIGEAMVAAASTNGTPGSYRTLALGVRGAHLVAAPSSFSNR